jgi:hypothetical protein
LAAKAIKTIKTKKASFAFNARKPFVFFELGGGQQASAAPTLLDWDPRMAASP